MPETRTAAGWFLPDDSLVVLERDPGLVVLDSLGNEVARFAGPAAELLRARLSGKGGSSPLLEALTKHVADLQRFLDAPALELSPAALLERSHWGLLFVELTAKCNERCLHCYADSSPARTEELPRETVEAVVREAAAMGFQTVQFTGGDPLLCPFVAEMAQLAKDLGVPEVEIYTNGVLLNEKRYAELSAAGARFAFSLYARDPEVHDAITRLPGSHKKTTDAIRRAVEGGSQVRVGVVATRPEHEAQAVEAVRLAYELGVSPMNVGVEVSREVGRGEFAGRPTPMAPPPDGGAPAAPPGDADEIELQQAGGAHAWTKAGKAAVLPDGWVVPCIFMRDLRLGRVGPEGGLREALEQPRVELAGAGDDVHGRLRAGLASLTCSECRVTSAMLCCPEGGGR